MNTLFDFITQVKGAEYLIAVAAIGLFVVFVEVLKPQPFGSLIKAAKDDIREITASGGYQDVMRTVGHVASAPFIVLAHIISLPFVFLFAVNVVLLESVVHAIDAAAIWMARMIVANTHALARAFSASMSPGWRPQESYLLGRKRGKTSDKKED